MAPTDPDIVRDDFLALVDDATAAIASSLDLDETLATIVRRAAEVFDVWECDLYEYSRETDELVADAVWGRCLTRDELAWVGTVISLKDHEGYRAIVDGQQIVAYAIDDPDLPPEERAQMEQWGEKAYISVPLLFQGQTIGCLDLVERRSARRFTAAERAALRRLAVPAAIAIHNARTYRRQQDRTRHLTSLSGASRAITSSLVLEDVLELITEHAGKALGSSQCMIYEYDAERDATVSRALYEAPGFEDPDHESLGTSYPLDDYPSDRAILESRTLVVEHVSDEDIWDDSRESMCEHGEKTCLTAPLYFGDEPLGTLVLIEVEHERHYTPEELELTKALAEQAAIAIHNARLFRRQEMQNQRLITLTEVSRAINASLGHDDVLERVRSAVEAFFFEAPTKAEVWLRDGRGFVPFRPGLPDGKAAPRLPDKLVAQAIGRHRAAQNGDGRRGRRLVVPLVMDRVVEGYLDVRCRRRSRLSDDEVQVVEILVGNAAIALENARNYSRLEGMYLETVRALAAAIEAKDHYTAEHGDMLASMAIAVGRRLGLDDRALRDVRYAAVLHDIGKIGIPGAILNKPDRLTEEEFAVMAKHTVIGEGIISHIDYLAPIAGMIRSAHERWDGRGYPDRLSGQQIPLASRILLVCDAYHAMTSHRPYRTAMPEEDALEELRRNAGTQFDPIVVDAFLEAWPAFEGSELPAVTAPPAAVAG